MYLNACLIRCFEPTDLKKITNISRASFLENYPDQFFLGLYHHAPKSFLVAVVDGHVIGYIMCRIERRWVGYNQVMRGHIISFAIIPEYKRCGIGTRLLEASVKAMKSYGVVEIDLEMRVASEEALLFYKKHGFKIKKTMKKYYKDGTDAYYMVKRC